MSTGLQWLVRQPIEPQMMFCDGVCHDHAQDETFVAQQCASR